MLGPTRIRTKGRGDRLSATYKPRVSFSTQNCADDNATAQIILARSGLLRRYYEPVA